MKKITIAIDGHSSCGKSTMAKDLARELGYVYIDTGAMYRAVTLYAIEADLFQEQDVDTEKLKAEMQNIHITFQFNPETGRPDTYLNNVRVEDRIRTMEVSSKVSLIAAIDFVRSAMVAQQQEMGQGGGVVMDGRDIGTTVFPNAELKIFVTASAEVRAERRYKELTGKGEECNYEEILENVIERDRIDSTRAVSPLRQADDAIVLDNSNLTIEEQKDWLIRQAKDRIGEE
ncbi:MAG: (d)CMP kinase [Bacteroidaceae bacterium]|nr:(d)CMP kinase [Bacteroidaceae bacterium]